MPEELDRFKKIRQILGWVLIGNLAVAAAKIIYGNISGSVSIKADGLHSLADAASNVIGLMALARTADAPDAEHPYGHKKLEVAGALGIGFLISMGLLEIGRALWNTDLSTHTLLVGPGGFAVVFVTLAVNIIVTWQESRWGKKLNSPILIADARHTLSDTFATTGVLAAFVLSRFGLAKMDVFIGVLIIILVGRAAFFVFKQGMDTLLDRSILDVSTIEQIVRSVSGVLDCHRVRSRGMIGAVFVDFHILVDSKITVEDAHHITHLAEEVVRKKFPDVIDVVIHTEPVSDGREPYPWEGRKEKQTPV